MLGNICRSCQQETNMSIFPQIREGSNKPPIKETKSSSNGSCYIDHRLQWHRHAPNWLRFQSLSCDVSCPENNKTRWGRWQLIDCYACPQDPVYQKTMWDLSKT